MVGVVVLVGVLLAVVLVASGGDDAADEAGGGGDRSTSVAAGPAEVGAPAPEFTLPGLDGGTVALDDYAGKPVMVNFWASWCTPCRKEFPLFEAAQEKYKAQGLEIIGVSYNDIAFDSRAFVESEGARWAFARDPDGRLAETYGVRAIPQTFFIDGDGKIVSRLFGITSAEDLDAEIKRILPKRPRG